MAASHSYLVFYTSSFWSIFLLPESLGSNPRRHDLGTESGDMQNVSLGGGRGFLDKSWPYASGITPFSLSDLDSVLTRALFSSAFSFCFSGDIRTFCFALLAVCELCCGFDVLSV